MDELGAVNLAGAALMPTYARALGAKVGERRRPALFPPVTGMLDARQGLLDRAGGRPERPLARRRRAAHRRGSRSAPERGSAPAARCAPGPSWEGRRGGARVGGPRRRREGRVLDRLAGRAHRPARGPWSCRAPAAAARWVLAYAAVALVIASLPVLALLAGLAVALPAARRRRLDRPGGAGAAPVAAGRHRGRRVPLRALVLALVRLLALGLDAGRTTRSTACVPCRPGRRCGSSTRPAPGCSRSTPAR